MTFILSVECFASLLHEKNLRELMECSKLQPLGGGVAAVFCLFLYKYCHILYIPVKCQKKHESMKKQIPPEPSYHFFTLKVELWVDGQSWSRRFTDSLDYYFIVCLCFVFQISLTNLEVCFLPVWLFVTNWDKYICQCPHRQMGANEGENKIWLKS